VLLRGVHVEAPELQSVMELWNRGRNAMSTFMAEMGGSSLVSR